MVSSAANQSKSQATAATDSSTDPETSQPHGFGNFITRALLLLAAFAPFAIVCAISYIIVEDLTGVLGVPEMQPDSLTVSNFNISGGRLNATIDAKFTFTNHKDQVKLSIYQCLFDLRHPSEPFVSISKAMQKGFELEGGESKTLISVEFVANKELGRGLLKTMGRERRNGTLVFDVFFHYRLIGFGQLGLEHSRRRARNECLASQGHTSPICPPV